MCPYPVVCEFFVISCFFVIQLIQKYPFLALEVAELGESGSVLDTVDDPCYVCGGGYRRIVDASFPAY